MKCRRELPTGEGAPRERGGGELIRTLFNFYVTKHKKIALQSKNASDKV